MTVGLPGTGLGALFYLVLALGMPVREIYRTVRGRSSLARWRFIARQLGMTGGILGALWGQAWLFACLAHYFQRVHPTGFLAAVSGRVALDSVSIFSNAAFVGFAVLALLLGSVHIARLVVRRVPKAPHRSEHSHRLPLGTLRPHPPGAHTLSPVVVTESIRPDQQERSV